MVVFQSPFLYLVFWLLFYCGIHSFLCYMFCFCLCVCCTSGLHFGFICTFSFHMLVYFWLPHVFVMAAVPFLCNGTLLFQGNLPRVLPVIIYKYASCFIPYIWKANHSMIRTFSAIWIPDKSVIQIPTVCNIIHQKKKKIFK